MINKKFIFFLFLPILFGCDPVKGITVKHDYKNEAIPINEIFLVLKNKLNYKDIILIFVPANETFELFPNFGKKQIKEYEYISIYYENDGLIIENINHDREYASPNANFLHIYSYYLGGVSKETIEKLEIYVHEIIDILTEEYPQYFNKNNFIFGYK